MRSKEIDKIVKEMVEPSAVENFVESLISVVKFKASIEEGYPWTHYDRETLRKIQEDNDMVKNSVIDNIIVKLVSLR